MTVFRDAAGTTESSFQIAIGGSGVRTLRFRNAYAGDLTWNPTANQTLTLPDATGTLLLSDASNLMATINLQSGVSYALTATDRGKMLEFSNSSTISVVLPNSLPTGFSCTIVQAGTGQVAFSTAAGAIVRHPDGHAKTAKQWAMCTLYVRSNVGGTSAEYVLGGYTAA